MIRRKVLNLATKDISASGTFIMTQTSFEKDARFILDFTTQSDNIEEIRDIKGLKGCIGNLVLSTPDGIAIQFDKECKVES